MQNPSHQLLQCFVAISAWVVIAVYPNSIIAYSGQGTQVTIEDGNGATSYRNHLPPEKEVHVIGVYETMPGSFREHPIGNPQVDVVYDSATGEMQPITLVLSSYEANHWSLNIDPLANIDEIVLNGYYEQTVSGAGGIPIRNFSGVETGAQSLGSSTYAHNWPLSTGGSRTQGLLVAVEELLDTRISSFTGQYRASQFTVTGAPDDLQASNARLGAGSLVDGPSPDLIYDIRTGEVKIDLADLAAQYPFGSGEIWWQHFDAQRLFISLANHDGSFDINGFDATDINEMASFIGRSPALNENRLGYDGVSLTNWDGGLISLGELLPSGINSLPALQEYFAAAHYATDRQSGEFDLRMVPEPNSFTAIAVALLIMATRRDFIARG